LKKLIVKKEDSVRFYFLCREDVKRVQWIGGKEVARERDYYLH